MTAFPAEVPLKRINAFTLGGYSMAIVDPSLTTNGKQAYISFPQPTKYFGSKPFAALHLPLNDGAGSEKIQTFARGYYDQHFTGLNISLATTTDPSVIVVTITNQAPVTPYAAEAVPVDDPDEEGAVDDSAGTGGE